MSNNILFYLIIILLILLTSCQYKHEIYDIEPAKLNFYTFTDDNILFQFNEPVVAVNYTLKSKKHEKSININNKFPIANILIHTKDFLGEKFKKIELESIDTSNNKSSISMPFPIINTNPALIKINEAQIKYSKKRPQKIVLKSFSSGSTAGYIIILYIRGKPVKITLSPEKINQSDLLTIYITSSKENFKNSYEIKYSQNSTGIILKNRLSQISSLIYIMNQKNEIVDYLFYYNSKKHDIKYYETNRLFNKLKNKLYASNIEPKPFDIANSTTLKTIQRLSGDFIVKNH